MARLKILQHVDDKQVDIIRRLTTTTTMQTKLEELYEPDDGTTKLHTLGALFNMCVFQEEEDINIPNQQTYNGINLVKAKLSIRTNQVTRMMVREVIYMALKR